MRLSFVNSLFLLSPTASAFGVHSNSFVTKRNAIFGGGVASPLKASIETEVISSQNLDLLSPRGREAVQQLIEFDQNDNSQEHVYANWPEPGEQDEGKKQLAEQLADLDASYPGGLKAYLSKAKTLLKESAEGINPFAEFEALVPEGETLTFGEERFLAAEQKGLEASGGAVFCLVAGGLGERLGYSGIKLSLETNLCDNACYLEFYSQYILALQRRAQKENPAIQIPLVIMTSGDTDPATRRLLEDNNYFGMNPDQVTIVTQDKVPALKDGNAGLALDEDNRWEVQTKPHGHGDVHHLLYREGLVDKWEAEGKTHVVFLQDTNGLVVNSVLPTLGVSVDKGFHMNSICIPRLAGEAAGAIARLEHKSDPDKSLVINVEYNQLDPLLRTQGEGDVPDPNTGFSPFPGNANNLVMELKAYARTLRGEDQGVVLEFVNPKYRDDSRTDFKKPTRLECMMQDIPKLFQKEMGRDANIGFTMFDRWYTFSPAKNALEAGQDAVKKGSTAPGTMSSAESDLYLQNQRKLQFVGVDLPDNTFESVAGIDVTRGPRVILSPSFALTSSDLKKIDGSLVKMTQRSSLLLDGENIEIRSLDLNGAMVVHVGPDTHLVIDGYSVSNQGWELKELDPNTEYPETIQIRGYTMEKRETAEFMINEPGKFILDSSGQVRKIE